MLAAEGRADIHPELRRLSREGRWDEMARLVDDDLLDAVVLRGDPDRVAARVRDRFAGHVDRVGLYAPGGLADEALAAVVAGVRGGPPGPDQEQPPAVPLHVRHAHHGRRAGGKDRP